MQVPFNLAAAAVVVCASVVELRAHLRRHGGGSKVGMNADRIDEKKSAGK